METSNLLKNYACYLTRLLITRMKLIYDGGFVPGICPKLFISETVKYNFIHFLIVYFCIRVLLRTQLALRDPINPGFMRFKEFRSECTQKYGS
jgi:hypothetical protein